MNNKFYFMRTLFNLLGDIYSDEMNDKEYENYKKKSELFEENNFSNLFIEEFSDEELKIIEEIEEQGDKIEKNIEGFVNHNDLNSSSEVIDFLINTPLKEIQDEMEAFLKHEIEVSRDYLNQL